MDVKENIVICINENENNNVNNFKALINQKTCPTIYCCNKDWRNYIKNTTTCSGESFTSIFCIEKTEEVYTTNILTTTSIPDETSNNFTNENYDENVFNSSYLINNSMDENSNIEINLIEKQNCIKNTQNKTNEEIYDSIIENYIKNYNDTYFDDLIIFEGYNTFIYQMITSEQEQDLLNGNNISTNQLSMIDLGECENILKYHYHIDRNLSLIIILFEKVSNFSSERVVQYEVYEPINRTKLDLLVCENVLISIYTRVTLSEKLLNLYNSLKKEGYDLFDINSAFYQDYCTPFTSPNGTDVILDD